MHGLITVFEPVLVLWLKNTVFIKMPVIILLFADLHNKKIIDKITTHKLVLPDRNSVALDIQSIVWDVTSADSVREELKPEIQKWYSASSKIRQLFKGIIM